MNQEIKLYLTEYGYLDLDNERNKNFGIPLIFQASDVADITKRKSNFSKSIKIPGTPNNNNIFSQAFEITKYGGFNATTKHNCILLVDSNPIIQGYMLLNGITKLQVGEGYQIEYSVNIYDEVNNFFSDLKQKKLKELSFSSGFTFTSYKNNDTITTVYPKGDHIFNETNALNSTENEIYKYPLVNYNYNDILYRNPGYTYPYNATSLGFLYPAISMKYIFNKIMYDIGYTYESNFLNDNTGSTYANQTGTFSRLYNIYNGDEKITEKIFCDLCLTNWSKATNYTNWLYMPFGNGRNDIAINSNDPTNFALKSFHSNSGEVYDSLVNWFWINGMKEPLIKIPDDGDYYVSIYLDVDIDQGGTFTGATSGTLPVRFGRQMLTTYDIRVESGEKRLTQVGGQHDSGSTYTLYPVGDYSDAPLDIHLTSENMGFSRYGQAAWTDTGYIWQSGYTFTGRKGDVFYIQTNIGEYTGLEGYLPSSNLRIPLYKINSCKVKLFKKTTDEKFIDKYGTELNLASFLPDMTQADFIKNIMTMFNLYIRYDKYNNKLLHIEPFDTFYSEGTIQDWSSKVDYSDKIDISTLTDKLKNQYVYKYTDGDDYYSQQFINKNAYNFGSKTINLNNQYLTDEIKNENKYQAYQSQNIKTDFANRFTTGMYSGITYMNIPILTEDISTTTTTIYTEKKATKSIMGLYNFYTFYYKTGVTYEFGYYLKLLRSGNTTDAYNIYNFQEVSMLSPKTKTYVLNADDTNYTLKSNTAISLQYSNQYGNELYSGNTYNYSSIEYLYPTYHQNQLENIIDQDAREVEMYINLSINDIVKLDFRNKIFIDGQNYLLQKINFDPTATDKPSKVLLLKEI